MAGQALQCGFLSRARNGRAAGSLEQQRHFVAVVSRQNRIILRGGEQEPIAHRDTGTHCVGILLIDFCWIVRDIKRNRRIARVLDARTADDLGGCVRPRDVFQRSLELSVRRQGHALPVSRRSFYMARCGSLLTHRLILVASSVRHQRKKKVAVFQYVGPDILPIPGNAIIQWRRRAHRARQGYGPKFKLVRARRLPCFMPAIAVDSRTDSAVGVKSDLVFRPIVRGERAVVAALKSHQLPRSAAKIGDGALRWSLRMIGTCRS